MLDEEFIKERYASLTSEQLIVLAEQDLADLRPEALALLKEEFRARGLSMSYFEPKNASPEKERTEETFNFSGVPHSIVGITTEDIMPVPEPSETELQLDNYSQPELEELIKKCDTEAKKNGFIAIIGVAITFITFEMAANGGTFVVAWGAIVFGGFKFISALREKNKYESLLKERTPGWEEKKQ